MLKATFKQPAQPLSPVTAERTRKRTFPGSLPALRIVNLINYLLFSELGKFFFIAAGVLVLTSIIFTLFDLIPSLSRSQLGWGYAAIYLTYLAPQIAYYISPFAFLLAVLTLQGVLSKTNQLTAILTSGQSYLRLAMPLIVSGLLLISIMFWTSERILPFSNQEQDARYNRIKGRKTELAVTAFGQSWVRDAERNIYGYQIDPATKKLLNTSVYHVTPGGESLEEMIQADEAVPAGVNDWTVTRGYRYRVSPESGVSYEALTGAKQTLTVPEGSEIFTREVNEAAKMTFRELKSYIKYLADLGVSTTSLRVDLEKKLSFPFSCFTLMVLAFPFTSSNSRRSNLAGIGISIVIGFVYWIMASVFESAGRQAYLPAGLCVWGPQALFIALGLSLTFRRK